MAENDLNSALSEAMKDPRFSEILSSLKQKSESGELDVSALLGQLTSGSKAAGDTAGNAAGAEPADKDTKKLRSPNITNHIRLISALRPYLSDGKKSAVDNILRIGEVSRVFDNLSGR